MIDSVAIEQPAIVMFDDGAEPLGVGARQIGVKRFEPIDAEIAARLQREDILITGEIPGLRPFRPMHGLRLAQAPIHRIGILHGCRRENAVAFSGIVEDDGGFCLHMHVENSPNLHCERGEAIQGLLRCSAPRNKGRAS